MRFSLTNGPFTRKLSVQKEETSLDSDDVPLEPVGSCAPPPLLPTSPLATLTSGASIKETESDFDMDMEIIDLNELRKLSVTSMTSMRSCSSLSSTCSAPGGISTSIGEMGDCSGVPKKEAYKLNSLPMRKLMTSRPSFISLCSIVSETSESPVVAKRLLPAPLQVELDFMQRSGVEGDEPTCRSHLPILRCPSDYDINEMDVKEDWLNNGQHFARRSCKKGLVNGIKQFPKRMRKLSTEKNRFDVYSISDETREQLKRLYVY